jgi:hypothetical protein
VHRYQDKIPDEQSDWACAEVVFDKVLSDAEAQVVESLEFKYGFV